MSVDQTRRVRFESDSVYVDAPLADPSLRASVSPDVRNADRGSWLGRVVVKAVYGLCSVPSQIYQAVLQSIKGKPHVGSGISAPEGRPNGCLAASGLTSSRVTPNDAGRALRAVISDIDTVIRTNKAVLTASEAVYLATAKSHYDCEDVPDQTAARSAIADARTAIADCPTTDKARFEKTLVDLENRLDDVEVFYEYDDFEDALEEMLPVENDVPAPIPEPPATPTPTDVARAPIQDCVAVPTAATRAERALALADRARKAAGFATTAHRAHLGNLSGRVGSSPDTKALGEMKAAQAKLIHLARALEGASAADVAWITTLAASGRKRDDAPAAVFHDDYPVATDRAALAADFDDFAASIAAAFIADETDFAALDDTSASLESRTGVYPAAAAAVEETTG